MCVNRDRAARVNNATKRKTVISLILMRIIKKENLKAVRLSSFPDWLRPCA